MTGSHQLSALLDDIDLLPGDVIVTGNSDQVSASIQRATSSPVSHVLVAMGEGVTLEANTFRNTANDINGGIYLRSFGEAWANPYLDHVVIRRPQGVVHDDVVSAGEFYLRAQPTFSGFGIVLNACLIALGRSWSGSVAGVLLGDDDRDRLAGQIAAIAADGEQHMVCSELAYRILHHAHVPLKHDALFLQHAIALLTDELAEPMEFEPPEEDLSVVDRLRRARDTATRQPEDPSTVSAIERLGLPLFIRLSRRHLRDAYRTRTADAAPGDIADLITPRDFLDMQPFSDIARLTRDGDTWSAQPGLSRNG